MTEPRLTPEEQAVWRAFLEAHARVTVALDRELAAAGCELDLREYDLLVHLAEAGESGLRLRDLAVRALISRSNVTRRAERLAARGLLERCPDSSDARGVIARLTPAGRRALRRAATVHLAGVKRLVFGRRGADLAVVRAFLEGVGREA